jgi:DNA-binding SARP family transcriptional activator
VGKCRSFSDSLQFQVLGPLGVFEGGRLVPFHGKVLRALLSSLLLHSRQLRTADELIDDLWGDHAPATARSSLHNHLSRLRRTLGADVLETRPSGYVVAFAEEQLDAARFEQLLARSRNEDDATKVRTLEAALSLWRGPPFVDVRYHRFAQGEIRRLEELHVLAQEELLAAKAGVGSYDTLVPELQRLVATHPFRERGRMQLMVALARCGRSIEALVAYTEWRRILADSWGVEPSRQIRQLAERNSRRRGRGRRCTDACVTKLRTRGARMSKMRTTTFWISLTDVRLSDGRRRALSEAKVEQYRQWLENGSRPPAGTPQREWRSLRSA